jgi:nucleoid-associated protein YgaU
MLEGLNSPDMSHFIEVRKGDSLTLMCENIYGAPDYYLQVAEVNGIIDFRNLTPGQKILFPRLEK